MAEYLFKDGNLTIRATLYLNEILISLVMGFTSPVIVNFFMSHLTPEYIATCTIIFRLSKVGVSFVKQSIVATHWVSQNFIKIMILTDISFFSIACIGESNPELRFLVYNMICICGTQLMKAVKMDNINNCIHDSALTIFKAKVDTWGLLASLFGAALLVAVTKFISPSVTFCMIVECLICAIAHWFQLYANNRIKKLIYRVPKEYTIKEVINDIVSIRRVKRNRRELNKLNKEDVLDQ